ncbi:MAG: alanine racemase [Acidobacteriota bacterium]
MTLKRRDFILLSGLSLASMGTAAKIKGPFRTINPVKNKKASPESCIEINAENIKWNLNRVKQKVKTPIMAVIKANAYGHGLVEFGKILDQMGIDALMVCKLLEAVRLRKSGVSCPVYNFGPVIPENTADLVKYNISQFLHPGDFIKMDREAQKLEAKINAHIHIDTGMNRLGFAFKNALPIVRQASSLKGLSLSGISTTLSEDKEFDKIQLQRFQSIYDKAKNLGINLGQRHAASSAGIFESDSYYLDMVRPGIALYGYYPNKQTQKENSLSLRPVLEFKSRVVDIKTLNPGDSVSYHRAYKAKKKEKIAVVPVGYSDGYPLSEKAEVIIGGKRYPVLNTITANHLEVLINLEPNISPGDEVTLIGVQENERITADDLAERAGISNYKVLIGLNPLIPRYVRQDSA